MWTRDPILWYIVAGGGLVAALALLRGVTLASVAQAQELIDVRRQTEVQRREENAAAEAAGRAAAMEPLNLNPDGSIEEPILGVVE